MQSIWFEVCMDLRDSKFEFMILVAAVALMIAMLTLFKSLGTTSHFETKNITYEMPRPVKSELISDFDLGDREIVRNYINAKEKNAPPAAAKNKPVASVPKKNAVKADKKSAKTEEKRPVLAVNIISGTESANVSVNTPTTYGNNGKTVATPTDDANAPTDPNADKKDNKTTVSLAEWRKILMAQPTTENVNKFLTAFHNRELTAHDFYQLSQELILTKEKSHQAAGLYALQGVNSATSFAIVAKQLDILTPENHPTGQQILLAYSQPNRLIYLAQDLQTSDPVVVKRAAESITAGLELAKSGHALQDPRTARGTGVTGASAIQPYNQFVPFFEHWKQNGDPTQMSLADAFLTTWHS
jgi:hypothetical protein